MDSLIGWIIRHQQDLQLLGVISLATFVVTLIALPLAVINLPVDYFTRDRREAARRGTRHPLAWGTLAALKNLLGIVFILAGLAMLVLPGQGMITILVGLGLTNFPGKFALERRLVRNHSVSGSLNWIRQRAGRPPLQIPEEH